MMRRTTALSYYYCDYAAPAPDDDTSTKQDQHDNNKATTNNIPTMIIGAVPGANRGSALMIRRTGSMGGSKNNSPVMTTTRKVLVVPTMQQQQQQHHHQSAAFLNNWSSLLLPIYSSAPSTTRGMLTSIPHVASSYCPSTGSSISTIKRHRGPTWKPNFCSIIVMAITAISFIVAVLTNALVTLQSTTITAVIPAGAGAGGDPLSFVSFSNQKRQSLQLLQQQIQPLAQRRNTLTGGGTIEETKDRVHGLTSVLLAGQNRQTARNLEERDAPTNTFCTREDDNVSASKDDDDAHVKGPVVDTSGLRQLSNRDTHHKDSKCPRNIHDTQLGTTLVMQMTMDRLPFLKETCQRWSSPIIAVICLSPTQVNSEDWTRVQERYYQLCPHMKMVPVAVDDMARDYKYPINQLRNRGLDEVETTHVLMIDVDFVPSANLDHVILKAIQIQMEQDEEEEERQRDHNNGQHMNSKQSMSKAISSLFRIFQFGKEHRYQYHALVVPAFERKMKPQICQNIGLEECIQYTSMFPEFMPRSIESLKQCMNSTKVTMRQDISDLETKSILTALNSTIASSKCIVFHSDYFPKGHRDTKSAQWLHEGNQNSLRPIPCINIDAYEPYLALPWCPSTKLNHNTLQAKVMERADQYNDDNRYPMEPWAPLTPYYDERFYGYGKNKLQHIFHLQQTGYAFSVIPTMGFLTHHPHPDSNTKIHWKERSQHYVEDQENVKVKMKRLYKNYKCEIEQQYQRVFQLPTESC